MKHISLALLALCLCLTGCEKKTEPKTNVGKRDTVLWEFKTGVGGASSPAIGSDGTVYVGSRDHKLYTLSSKSGDKLWEFKTGGAVDFSPAIKTDSKGPAESPWPMFGQNAQHTGRVMKK